MGRKFHSEPPSPPHSQLTSAPRPNSTPTPASYILSFLGGYGGPVGSKWETRAQGLYLLQKKMFSDPRDLRVKAGEAWVGHSIPTPHTHKLGALTWTPRISLVGGLGLSGLGSSESE